MLGVNETFKIFLSERVNLSQDITDKAKASREWLIECMSRFDQDPRFPTHYPEKHIYFGSFSRKTKKQPLDDIDIMYCMKAAGCTYSETSSAVKIVVPDQCRRFDSYLDGESRYLNSRKVINAFVFKLSDIPQYSKAEIKRNNEAAILNLSSYEWSFDIVPCFFTSPDHTGKTYYIIPDGEGNWKKTDPRLDQTKTSEINSSHSFKVLQAIRLVKFWNKRPTMPSMSSYVLENAILDFYASSTNDGNKFPDVEFAKVIVDLQSRVWKPVMDPKGLQGDLNTLTIEDRSKISERAKRDSEIAQKAIDLDNQGNQVQSLEEWSKIFGEDFERIAKGEK